MLLLFQLSTAAMHIAAIMLLLFQLSTAAMHCIVLSERLYDVPVCFVIVPARYIKDDVCKECILFAMNLKCNKLK